MRPVHLITGSVRVLDAQNTLLELDHRLEGIDTYLSGTLEIEGFDWQIPVRVLTFGQTTLLHPLEPLSLQLPAGTWQSAKLAVADLSGRHRIPADLETALRDAGHDPDLMHESERRYVVNFVGEARDPVIRRARIELALASLVVTNQSPRKEDSRG